MAGLVTVLQPGQTLSAAGHFAGPWRDFQRLSLAAGAAWTFAGDGVEAAVFVMSGAVTLRAGDTDAPLAQGGALTIGLGSQVEFLADADGAELFITTVRVSAD